MNINIAIEIALPARTQPSLDGFRPEDWRESLAEKRRREALKAKAALLVVALGKQFELRLDAFNRAVLERACQVGGPVGCPKESGALKRTSMELTRALARFRGYDEKPRKRRRRK